MVASKEDLTLLGPSIESCVMWRSKPSPLRTWSQRWSRVSWFQRLSTRILKPSQHTYFEVALTSSLEDIRASRSQPQESDLAPKTPDTSGHLYGDTLNQLDLFGASLKMSKDTSRLDSQASSATWKKMVTEQRGEYSQRVKLAHHTRENESTFWPTPTTQDNNQIKGKDKRGTTLGGAVRNWPTPTVFDTTGGSYPTRFENGRWKSKHSADLNSPDYGAKLKDAVMNWPTPTARDYKGGRSLDALEASGRNESNSLPDAVNVAAQAVGSLNPDWVEWLMGVPTGWTGLGSWETE
jgi:hypothetical protein